MAIRVRHGGVSEFAKLGELAGKAQKSEREAEQAERRSLALQEHQVRRELAAEQVQLRKQLAQDAMQFEREKFTATQQFQLGLQFQRQQHDFDVEENGRLKEQAEVGAAMKAIEDAEGWSPEEKSRLKADFMARRAGGGLPSAAAGFGGAGKEGLELNRTLQGIGRLRDEIKEKVNFIGSFKEKKGWLGGHKGWQRQMGKGAPKDATEVEVLEYNQALQDIGTMREQLNTLNQKYDQALGMGVKEEGAPVQAQEDVSDEAILQRQAELKWEMDMEDPKKRKAWLVDAVSAKPATKEEAHSILTKVAKVDPEMAMALNNQWEQLFAAPAVAKKKEDMQESIKRGEKMSYFARGTNF